MHSFIGCLKKDRIEFTRSHKNIICIALLLLCGAVILITTALLPRILDAVLQDSSILGGDTSLSEFMGKFFPSDLRSSMGIFSSDVGVFYGLYVIFVSFGLMPDELSSGKIILPLCSGHTMKAVFISKLFIYGMMMSVPILPAYLLYYSVGSKILEYNFTLSSAILNAIVLTFAIFAIINLTIALSIIFRKKTGALAVMASAILVLPDALSFLSVGKFFPTYLLTFAYRAGDDVYQVIFPTITLMLLLLVADLYALMFKLKIHFDDRG